MECQRKKVKSRLDSQSQTANFKLGTGPDGDFRAWDGPGRRFSSSSLGRARRDGPGRRFSSLGRARTTIFELGTGPDDDFRAWDGPTTTNPTRNAAAAGSSLILHTALPRLTTARGGGRGRGRGGAQARRHRQLRASPSPQTTSQKR